LTIPLLAPILIKKTAYDIKNNVMFTKFEEIIEDHRKRNRQMIVVALVAFLVFFVLFNIVFAFLIFQSGPRSKVDALLSWQPSARQYAFTLIELLMLFWWVWLFLNYKLLQMRVSLVSDHMTENYNKGQIGIKNPTAWEEFERPSFYSKQVGSKILLAMTGLLILSTLFHVGSHSIPVILSVGLIAYEFTALMKGKKIEAFIRVIPQTYTAESTSVPNKIQTYLISGLSCGLVFTIATDQMVHFSNYDRIFFFLAFSGLSVASFLLVGMSKLFMENVRVADSARLNK